MHYQSKALTIRWYEHFSNRAFASGHLLLRSIEVERSIRSYSFIEIPNCELADKQKLAWLGAAASAS
jgi:hypothetical protein